MVSDKLVKWARENLARGVSVGDLTRFLLERGYNEQQINEILSEVASSRGKMETKPGITPVAEKAKRSSGSVVPVLGVVLLLVVLVVCLVGGVLWFFYEQEKHKLQEEAISQFIGYLEKERSEKTSRINEMSCTNETTCGKIKLYKIYVSDLGEIIERAQSIKKDTELADVLLAVESACSVSSIVKGEDYLRTGIPEKRMRMLASAFEGSYKPFDSLEPHVEFEEAAKRINVSSRAVKEYYLNYFPSYCETHYDRMMEAAHNEDWVNVSYEMISVRYCMDIFDIPYKHSVSLSEEELKEELDFCNLASVEEYYLDKRYCVEELIEFVDSSRVCELLEEMDKPPYPPKSCYARFGLK